MQSPVGALRFAAGNKQIENNFSNHFTYFNRPTLSQRLE